MRSILRFAVWFAVVLAVLVGLARLTAIRWWRVPTGDPYLEASIAPTLRGGDLIILWRLSAPSLGDLVLCPEPSNASAGGEVGRIVIGRMVAESGDVIGVRQGQLDINGDILPTDSACLARKFSISDPETDREVTQFCSLESIGSNVHMIGGLGPEVQVPIDEKPVEVNSGQLWLASDNRMFPYDSRDYGPLDVAACKETIVFRLVSAAGYFDTENRLTLIR